MPIKKFVSVEDMRAIGDWSRKYTWNVVFSDFRFDGNGYSSYVSVPSQFTEWMPVTEVSVSLANIEKYDFTGGIMNLSVPKSTGEQMLRISFLDERRLSVHYWITSWMNQIVNREKGYVLPIKNACCVCDIVYFDTMENNVREGQYYVYPAVDLSMQLDSSAEPVSNEVEFVIAGVGKSLLSTPPVELMIDEIVSETQRQGTGVTV